MEARHGPRRRVALAQFAPALGNLDANIERHLALAERAASDGANLCVFPELSLPGYFLKDLVPDVASTLDDERLRPLLDLSRRIDLVIGLVLRDDEFRYHNAVVYLTNGEVAHVHRKVYLPTYGMFDEQRYFAPGDRVRTFNREGFITGMLVCEDMWHLSAPYLLFVQGAHLIICPSVSPGRGVLLDSGGEKTPGSVTSWHELCRTVAAFTVSYVAYCNRVGYEDGVNFGGGSGVWGPDGKLLAEAGGDEEMTLAEIDLREVERQRQATPLMRDEKVEFTLRELERVFDEQTRGPY